MGRGYLKQTKLLPNHERFVHVFGERLQEDWVSIIKDKEAKNIYIYIYISITAEASVQLVTDNICGRNKPNWKFTSSCHLLHHPCT